MKCAYCGHEATQTVRRLNIRYLVEKFYLKDYAKFYGEKRKGRQFVDGRQMKWYGPVRRNRVSLKALNDELVCQWAYAVWRDPSPMTSGGLYVYSY